MSQAWAWRHVVVPGAEDTHPLKLHQQTVGGTVAPMVHLQWRAADAGDQPTMADTGPGHFRWEYNVGEAVVAWRVYQQ